MLTSAVYGIQPFPQLPCNGGFMDNAFSYVKEDGGLNTEKSHLYEGNDDSCHFDKNSIGATNRGFADILQDNADTMKKAVATIGPGFVDIDTSQESFQFQYNEPECDA